MQKRCILCADPDPELRSNLGFLLAGENCVLEEAAGGATLLTQLRRSTDLVILPQQLPDMSGFALCQQIRQTHMFPIIMLTARGDERDELLGFELGVDEYISKPFSPKILVARVEAILRRTGQSNPDEILSAGGIVIDKAAHQATVDDKPMDLSFKEFELLTYFLENEGIALSREKILNSVWNYDYFGDARTIDTHVKKLRSKMGDKGEYIKTVWGMGYKFEVGE